MRIAKIGFANAYTNQTTEPLVCLQMNFFSPPQNVCPIFGPMQAVIDLGSNTFNLLIGDANRGAEGILVNIEQPVGLGRGGIQNNLLLKDAEERALAVLSGFHKRLQEHGVTEIKAMATSAIRNATNGPEFARKIRSQFGISIQTLSGEEEAALIFEGALQALPALDVPFLVMDIGGGSVEFIIGKGTVILWKRSYEVGAIRLHERFKPSNPIEKDEELAIKNYLLDVLGAGEDSLLEAINRFKPTYLAGTAGSFESVHKVLSGDLGILPVELGKHFQLYSWDQWKVFKQEVVYQALAHREQLKNLIDFRRELIVVAGILIDFVQEKSETKHLFCLDFALKEGVFFKLRKDSPDYL